MQLIFDKVWFLSSFQVLSRLYLRRNLYLVSHMAQTECLQGRVSRFRKERIVNSPDPSDSSLLRALRFLGPYTRNSDNEKMIRTLFHPIQKASTFQWKLFWRITILQWLFESATEHLIRYLSRSNAEVLRQRWDRSQWPFFWKALEKKLYYAVTFCTLVPYA